MKSKQVNEQTGASIDLISYFIQDGSSILVFHGIATPEKFNSYVSTFERTMGNYARLTDAGKINVQPERIKVITVSKSATLESILRANACLTLETKEASNLVK